MSHSSKNLRTRILVLFVLIFGVALLAFSAASGPRVESLGSNLYAYISDNDGSANSTFLVGPSSILVVDCGLDRTEGGKILREIRKISSLPIAYIVNTHYHPDHQGGDGVVGPDATVISSPFTREKTIALAASASKPDSSRPASPGHEFMFRPATITFTQKMTVHLGDEPVEIVAAWPAHTMGDIYVYFPKERTVSTGDLYLTNSVPAMDEGSAAHWIQDLDEILALPADHFVPGHFEVGTRQTIERFRDYMADLDAQVVKLAAAGATDDEVRQKIQLPQYGDFRQYAKYEATFGDNAVAILHQIRASK
ncbi:MAG: MBL fold metallo-hydrolase [Candidatus Acidiferrales bacterium]